MKRTSINKTINEKELESHLRPYLESHKKRMESKTIIYKGVIYARLSDREIKNLKKKNQSVSSSITSQVVMLLRKAEELGILIVEIFVDDRIFRSTV